MGGECRGNGGEDNCSGRRGWGIMARGTGVWRGQTGVWQEVRSSSRVLQGEQGQACSEIYERVSFSIPLVLCEGEAGAGMHLTTLHPPGVSE